MTDLECIVDIRPFKKSFIDVHAVKWVSLTIKPGEFTALLGPNGAGKTTEVFQLIELIDVGFALGFNVVTV